METVMAGCCVQVQCTFGDFQRILQHLHKYLTTGAACPWVQFAFLLLLGFFLKANLPNHVHCTLCEKQKDEPNSGVQQCKCTNWGHAKCIHFTGIYSMLSIKTGWEVHNDIQLLSRKKGGKNVLLSATAIWQKKRQKKSVFCATC